MKNIEIIFCPSYRFNRLSPFKNLGHIQINRFFFMSTYIFKTCTRKPDVYCWKARVCWEMITWLFLMINPQNTSRGSINNTKKIVFKDILKWIVFYTHLFAREWKSKGSFFLSIQALNVYQIMNLICIFKFSLSFGGQFCLSHSRQTCYHNLPFNSVFMLTNVLLIKKVLHEYRNMVQWR